MKKYILIPFFLLHGLCISQNFDVKFNLENAIKTYEYLNQGEKNIDLANEILRLKGTEGMIAHDSRFNSEITKSNFIAEIISNEKTNAFNFKSIRKKLDVVKKTINILEKDLGHILNRVKYNLSTHVTEKEINPITVFFVLGGNSDGYIMDGNNFYIEIQFYDADIEALILLMTHELYHIIQQQTNPYFKEIEKMERQDLASLVLVTNLFTEGSASYIADPLKIEHPKKHVLFNQKKYKRNLSKLKESFLLFEALLAYSKTEVKINIGTLYNIGFGGNWDSPFYFLGYEVFKQLEKTMEVDFMKKYLNLPPSQFLIDYINLYKSGKIKVNCKFSTKIEKAVFDIHKQFLLN